MTADLRALALGGVVVGLGLVLSAYLGAWVSGAAFGPGVWVMVAGVVVLLPSTVVLGGLRRGQGSRAVWVAALYLFLVLALGFGAALLLPAETVDGPFLFGIPLRAAIILFGVGITPSLVLPIAYAADFDRVALGASELTRLRAECERLRARATFPADR
ncbi:MAG: hypothetical protein ABJC19_01230 [Gemmatimonadota bacterium]